MPGQDAQQPEPQYPCRGQPLNKDHAACMIWKESRSKPLTSNWLSEACVLLKEGTLMDATIIEAPSSTKNKTSERDPEMHQTEKGNMWHFSMKAHIRVDAKTGFTHSFETTAANEHDLNQADRLLHGEEQFVFADAGYRGIDKQKGLKDKAVDWHVAERSGKIRALKKHPRINKVNKHRIYEGQH